MRDVRCFSLSVRNMDGPMALFFNAGTGNNMPVGVCPVIFLWQELIIGASGIGDGEDGRRRCLMSSPHHSGG